MNQVQRQKKLEKARSLLNEDGDPLVALDLIRELDLIGVVESKSLLGYAYEYGLGAEQNSRKAFELYSEAADLGSTNSMLQLAIWFRDGRGSVDRNDYKMIEWLNIAAEHSDSRAWFELGNHYQKTAGGDSSLLRKSFSCHQNAADLGHPKSQVWIAESLLREENLGRNTSKAVTMLQEMVEREDPRAQYLVADLHIKGNLLPRNFKRAFDLAIRAADGGEPDADLMLGLMYLEGFGTELDQKKARLHLVKALEAGLTQAKKLLEEFKAQE